TERLGVFGRTGPANLVLVGGLRRKLLRLEVVLDRRPVRAVQREAVWREVRQLVVGGRFRVEVNGLAARLIHKSPACAAERDSSSAAKLNNSLQTGKWGRSLTCPTATPATNRSQLGAARMQTRSRMSHLATLCLLAGERHCSLAGRAFLTFNSPKPR